MASWFLPCDGLPCLQPDREKEREDGIDQPGPLYLMYSRMTQEEDDKMADCWQKDADGTLIFTGLFSATVAQLLTAPIPDLKPSPGVTDPSFSPPTSAVLVNLLWFSSLSISLTCAVMGIALQQSARHYLLLTQSGRHGPDARARIRALFSRSVDTLFIKSLGILLPCYLHFSLLLFFIGLLIFLYRLNHTIFYIMAILFVLTALAYGFYTFLPLLQRDSLLSTPVSKSAQCIMGIVISFFLITFGRRFDKKAAEVSAWLFDGPINALVGEEYRTTC